MDIDKKTDTVMDRGTNKDTDMDMDKVEWPLYKN
jgi:hypothetical protein